MTSIQPAKMWERFATLFGVVPDGLWSAPGRLNLIGEHTDYNQGLALPFAIPQRTTVALGRRTDGQLLATSSSQAHTTQFSAAGLAPGSVDGWSAYAWGVLWALREVTGLPLGEEGLALLVESSVPPGAGLSSSAALECAVALAINDLYDLGLSREALAHAGQHAENIMVGAPTGVLDQTASLLSRAEAGLLVDFRQGTTTMVELGFAAAEMKILVADSGVRHQLNDGGYAARRAECEAGAQTLGVRSLREVSLDRLAEVAVALDPVVYRRVRHVVTENERVLRVASLLEAGRPEEVGACLTAAHVSLRDDFEVSVPRVDTLVEGALAAGALGARLVGGGFGGSVLALVHEEDTSAVRGSMEQSFARLGLPAPRVTEVVPSAAARAEPVPAL